MLIWVRREIVARKKDGGKIFFRKLYSCSILVYIFGIGEKKKYLYI